MDALRRPPCGLRRQREERGLLKREEEGRTHVSLYVRAMAKWLALALVTGCCCGVKNQLVTQNT